MITWFQQVFGKHLKWVLLLVLGVLLVTFIFNFGVPQASRSAQRQAPRMAFGVDLNDEHQMRPIIDGFQFIMSELRNQANLNQQQYEQLFLGHLAMRQLADQWGLSDATQQQVDAYLRAAPRFQKPDGSFDNAAYGKFRDDVEAMPESQRNFLLGTIAEYARLDMVRIVLGGPGYASAYAVENQLRLVRTQYDLEFAIADFAKFEPEIKDDPGAIEQLFARAPQNFPVPATARLSYLIFPAAAIPDPTSEQLREYVTAHKEQFPDVAPDNLGDKAEAVVKAWRESRKQDAMKDAATKAMGFIRELYDLQAPRKSPEIDSLLQKHNLALKPLPTVSQGKPAPEDSPVPSEVLQRVASILNDRNYFTPSPVPLADGAGVFFFEEGTPAREAKLDEVREEVAKVYRQQERERLFIAKYTAERFAIVKALSEGKSFAEAATAQGFEVKNSGNVSLDGIGAAMDLAYAEKFGEKPPADAPAATAQLAGLGVDMLSLLVQPNAQRLPLLLTLQPGEVSPLMPIPEHGVLVHVVKRETPALTLNSAEFKTAFERWAQQEANSNATYALGALIQQAQEVLQQEKIEAERSQQ